MIQFRENNFVPFFQIKYEYIKYVHVTCVELWFVFFPVSKTGIWRGVRSNLAPESSSFLLEAKRLWIRDGMGRSKRGCMRTQILPVCTCHYSGHVDCQDLGCGNSKNSSQKISIYFVGHQPPGHQHGCHFILLAN